MVELPASLEYETQPQKQGRPSLSKVGGTDRLFSASHVCAVLCAAPDYKQQQQ